MPPSEDPSDSYNTNGHLFTGSAAENLTRVLEGNTAGGAFEYVLSQPWRKPRNENEPDLETKNLAFKTPQHLNGLISEVLRLQNLSKTRALVAYVQIHVTLSEMFGTEGAANQAGPFEEPGLSPSSPLREVYRYVTQEIDESGKKGEPMIGVQVPVDLVRNFKSWTVRQGVTMSSVMLRYILFHISQHRQRFGLPGTE